MEQQCEDMIPGYSGDCNGRRQLVKFIYECLTHNTYLRYTLLHLDPELSSSAFYRILSDPPKIGGCWRLKPSIP